MIQFILDNSKTLTYVAMGFFLVFFAGIFYQDRQNNDPFPPAVACVISFVVFGLLVFFTSSSLPVSSGPWKQIYRNDVDATIELTYKAGDKKQTIVGSKSPVDLRMLQRAAELNDFLEIELKAKSGNNSLFKQVGITQDNVIAKNVDPSNAKIAKIEYRPIKGVAPKLFGKQGKPRASEKEGEIRITFESSKDKKLEKLFEE